MPYTKFEGYQPSGFGEEDFLTPYKWWCAARVARFLQLGKYMDGPIFSSWVSL